jgi:hypothetical protein
LKKKGLIIATVIFFLIVNLNHFWEARIGIWTLYTFMFLVIVFLVLSIICLIQIGKGFKEKFSNQSRNWTIGIMISCLGLIFLKPNGVINFNKLEGESLFIARRKSDANCRTVFKLKPENKFKETNVCFGISKISGFYEIQNDTIFFSRVSVSRDSEKYYEFAVIKKSKHRDEDALFRYRNIEDTIGHELWIIKNEIIK